MPIHAQYLRWIGKIVLNGDFGNALWTQTPVIDEIAASWPITLELSLLGLLVAILIAFPIGIYSAVRQDTLGDYLGRSVAIGFIAVPSFWVATMIIVFPSIWWGYMPSLMYTPFGRDPIRNLQMFIIPAVVLGMQMSGLIMRMTRTMMLEVLKQDYVRTAWAKGLKERMVIVRHALKNALIPIVTTIGLNVPYLIGGSVIIEEIFGLPGMGRLLVGATSERDYTLVSGILLVLAVTLVSINLLVDMTYGLLNPRVRYE